MTMGSTAGSSTGCCSTGQRPPGTCRFVWNEMLEQQAELYDIARMCGAKPPSPTFFTLGKAFTQLRRVAGPQG